MLTASTNSSCNVCQIEFENNARQRAHTKTDWHVYNLKRRVAALPPLALEVFTESVVKAKAATISDDGRANPVVSSKYPTSQEFPSSSKAHETHLQSSTHASNPTSSSPPETSLSTLTISPPSTPYIPSFSPTHCLFCPVPSQTLTQNLSHMSTSHGLFIPNPTSLIDISTFLKYLSTIITSFHECLYCGKIKDSAEAARQHMLSVGHCKLPEVMEEFEEFWEDDEDGEEEENVEGGEKRTGKGKIVVGVEGLLEIDEQLHLPSGRTVGHRSQAQARKNPSTTSRLAERKAIEESASASGVASRQLATRNSNLGMIGVSESQRRAVMVLEKKMVKRATRAQNQYQARVEKGGNKQKHFKPDVPGPQNG